MNQYQSINLNYKIDLINDASSQQIQPMAKLKPKYKFEKCIECKKRRKPSEDHNICRNCYETNTTFNPIGNEIIDGFIKSTHIYYSSKGKL